MGVDQRADHSLRVPRPDLSLSLGSPNACTQCHTDRDNQWAADAVANWFPDSKRRGPHYGEALHAAATNAPDAGPRLLALAGDASQPGIARATAIVQLQQIAAPNALFTVQRLLDDPDPLIRRKAERLLQQADISTRVDQGWAKLADPSRSVRMEATRLLAPLLRQRLPEKWRKQLQQGVDEYFQAQMVNADRPEAHLNLGLLLASIGETNAAIQNYRVAITLDPTFTPAYVNLADLYRQLKRDDQAQDVLHQGLSKDADDASLYHALGLSLIRSKLLPQAIEQLANAARLAPQNARYSYVYAIALSSNKQPQQAIEVLQQALKTHPRDRDLLGTLVTLNHEQGKPQQASRYLSQLQRYYPNDPQTQALVKALGSDDGK